MLEIGNSLRDARERRGLTYAEIETATLIPARYLQALELEQFDRLPEGLYRRSFLREYAEHLGLDGNVFVDDYELRFAAPEPEPVVPRRHELRGGGVLDLLPGRRTIAVAAAAVLAGVAVWLLGTGGTSRRPAPARDVTPPTGRATALPATTTAPAPRTTTERRRAAVLVLTATRGGCWLSVQIGSTSGPVVYRQTLLQGQTVRFGLGKPLLIRFGAPWNLDATIAGRPVTAQLPRTTGDAIATRTGLRAASGT